MATARDPRLIGAASAVLGVLLVSTMLLFMNVRIGKPAATEGSVHSAIDVVRKQAPTPPAAARRAPPPRRSARSAPTPLLGLDSSLAGLDVGGLPGLDADELDLGGGLLGDAADTVMTDDSVDVAPRPLNQPPMVYPSRAKAGGVTGHVLLSVLIGPTGRVEQVRVLESQPAGVFDEVAVNGVQQWTFEPASYKGENVRVWARQRVRFDLS